MEILLLPANVILGMIQEQGLSVVLLVILLVVFIYDKFYKDNQISGLIHTALKKSKEDSAHELAGNIKGRTVVDSKINQIINEEMIRSGANVVVILQYHNGGKNVNGVDFIKMSCTHESVYGVPSMMITYKDLPTSIVAPFSTAIENHGLVWFNDIREMMGTAPVAYSLLSPIGIKTLAGHGIYNVNNLPVGIVLFGWKKKTERVKQIEDFIDVVRHKVAGMLELSAN